MFTQGHTRGIWILFVTLLTVLIIPCFSSCSDDGEESAVNPNPPQYESVSGKYEITDPKSPTILLRMKVSSPENYSR